MERIFIREIFSRMANKNKKSRCLYSLIDGISGAGSYLWSCHFPGFYDHPQFSSPEAVLLLVITKNRYLSVKTFGKVQFSEHAQSNCFIFSANQICQTWLWACAEWWNVCELQTCSVGPSQRLQFLVLTKRSMAFIGPVNKSVNYLRTVVSMCKRQSKHKIQCHFCSGFAFNSIIFICS